MAAEHERDLADAGPTATPAPASGPVPTAVPASTAAPAARGAHVADVLREAVDMLAAAGVVDAAVDAELLVAHVEGLTRGGVQAAALRGDQLSSDAASAVRALVARRAAREPLQHVIGSAPFRRLELQVGPGVFVPRPETEIVAQLAIDALMAVPVQHPHAVDLCTGSGAIALALATEVPHARVWALERSPQACAWAARNIDAYGDGRTQLVQADLADAPASWDGTMDVVVSNPPYVPAAAVPADPEVNSYDPPEALYAGEDGLDAIRVLSRVALRLARPGAPLVLEHGDDQGAAVRGILIADGWRAAATTQDLTRRDRATTAIRP